MFEEESRKIVISSAVLKVFDISDYDSAISNIASIKLYLLKKQENSEDIIEEVEEVNLENDFEIIGVIDDELSSYAYIPFVGVSYLNLPNFSRVKIKVSDKNEIEKVRGEIIEMGFTISALSDTIEEANKIF